MTEINPVTFFSSAIVTFCLLSIFGSLLKEKKEKIKIIIFVFFHPKKFSGKQFFLPSLGGENYLADKDFSLFREALKKLGGEVVQENISDDEITVICQATSFFSGRVVIRSREISKEWSIEKMPNQFRLLKMVYLAL